MMVQELYCNTRYVDNGGEDSTTTTAHKTFTNERKKLGSSSMHFGAKAPTCGTVSVPSPRKPLHLTPSKYSYYQAYSARDT